ncbi:MAG: SpoIID/LytB domain-containing protein [Parachlamydiales bacterium]|nr:SpoIID/LytB domain-containing protein [Parachlamydiales bacterium]
MKKGLLAAGVVIALATIPLHASTAKHRALAELAKNPPKEIAVMPSLKILLDKETSEAFVEVKGGYKIYDPRTGQQLGRGLLGKSFNVEAMPTGIKWGEEFPGIYQVAIIPASGTAFKVNGVPFKGSLLVYQIGHHLSLVNEVSVEDYVKSTLAASIDTSFPQEVICALAIAARTEAYYKRMTTQEAFWQLDADEIGYSGMPNAKDSVKINEAVDTTRYLVMQSAEDFAAKGLFPAQWTANSAGKTAPYHVMHRTEVIGPRRGVEAAYANHDRKESSWTLSMKKNELAQLVGLEHVTKVSLYTDSFSEKVYNIRFYDDKKSKDMDYFTFQKLVGLDKLPSSDFTVAMTNESISFAGFGQGPGIGLCLYSAEKMAEQGANAVQILTKFFPETQLVIMPTLPLKSESIAKVQSLIMTKVKN